MSEKYSFSGLQTMDIFLNEGEIKGISSWSKFEGDYAWYGSIANLSWITTDNLSPTEYIGYEESSLTACTPFELDDNDYINGYRVFYNEYILGLYFYTFKGDVYKCPDYLDRSDYIDSGKIVYHNYTLSGFIFEAEGIIDAIQFQFTQYMTSTTSTSEPGMCFI